MKLSTRLLAIVLCALMLLSAVVVGIVSAASADAATTVQLTYNFATNDRGYAQGTISLTPSQGSFGTYFLYWADDTAALENYGEIEKLDITSGTGTVTMPKYTVIPADATKLIAFKATTEPTANERTVANADAVYTLPQDKLFDFDTKDALYTFGAISDAQLANDSYGSNSYPYDEEHLAAALETLHARNVDFTISSGDTVNDQNGNQTYLQEYRAYQRILADSSYAKPVYEAIGNHDVGTVWDKNGNYYNDNEPFITATGLDSKSSTINSGKPYFEITEPTTGDHFIFMALEDGFYTNQNTQLSSAQLDWLEGLLKKYHGDGKKIFIIEHANIEGWGSGDKPTAPYYYDLALSKNSTGVKRFISLMETYKECVIITGHTHLELSAQYNYSDNNGTSAVMIHNSAIGGVRRLVNGTIDRTAVKGLSEGYIVEVYEDAILFNGTNMYYNETMPKCCYVVPVGENTGNITTQPTATESPVNPADKITVTLKSSGSDTDWVLNSTDRYVMIVDTDTNKEYVATLTAAGWTAEIPASVKNITFHRVKNDVISHTWLAGNRGTDTNYYITGDSRGHWENETLPDYANVYLPGSFNSWDQNDAFIKTDDANIVTRTLELKAGTYTFKVIEGSTWLGNGGTIEDTTTKTSSGGWEMTASAGDCTLVATGGTYTFNFNTSTNKLIVLHNTEPEPTPVPTTIPTTAVPVPTPSVTTTPPTTVPESTPAVTTEPASSAEVSTTSPTTPLPEYKYGDADLNGIVNVKDATAVQKHVASLITLEDKALVQADATGDGDVNVKDATAIQKLVAGLITVLPAEGNKDTAVTGALAPHYEQAKNMLEQYYIYSSYDQYAALKYEFKYGYIDKSETEVAQILSECEEALAKVVDDIGGYTEDPNIGEITIYFSNNKKWSTVYAYTWGTSGNFAAWPGTKMTKAGTNSQGEDIYKITVDYQKYQNIIFTNGSGAQTIDIPIVAKDGMGYYITGGSGTSLTYGTYEYIA